MLRLLLLTFLLSSLYVAEIGAQTIAGGEIYYELLSSKKYKVTAHLYRMCDKAPLNTIAANVYGGGNIIPMNFQRVSISKINDTCGNPCNKQNAFSNVGYEKHTFTDTVDFNASPYDVFVTKSVCIVNFGISMSGRSLPLTTIASGRFYLDASVNICLSGINSNVSPLFSMDPKFQMACNLPMIYSPGPLDTMDNDSFAFSLVDPQSDYNTSLTYNGSFSTQIPMSPFCLPPGIINCKALPNAKPPRGFSFDKQTCMTVFTPNECNEIGCIKYRIDEYRFNKKTLKQEWLGYITREMVVQVYKATTNNPPLMTGANVLTICKGDKICNTMVTSDTKVTSQTASDTTQIFWDHGIKDATFRIIDPTVRERQGEFCWQTKKNSNRLEPFFYTVATFDKQCNSSLISKTFVVTVKNTPQYFYTNSLGSCGQVKWNITTAFDSMYPNFKGTSNTVIRSFQTGQTLYTGNGLNDSVKINENGKILVEHFFNIECPLHVMDTITVTSAIALPDINDNKNAVVCKNLMMPYSFKASRISGLKSFSWFLNDTLINQSDTTIMLALQKNSLVKIKIENFAGCASERSVGYTLKKHDAISSITTTVCPGEFITIHANNATLAKPVTYQWKINGIDTAVNDSNLTFKINKDSKILLLLKDAAQCMFTDSVSENVLPDVNFNLNYTKEVCKDSATIVRAKNIKAVKPFTINWAVDGKSVNVFDSVLALKPSKYVGVSIEVKDQNGCGHRDSVGVQVQNTPEIILTHQLQACANTDVQIIPSIINRPSKINYQWSFNKAIISTDSFLNMKVTVSQLLKLRVSNLLNCFTEDTVNISIYPKTAMSIVHNKNYHPSSFITVFLTNSFSTYKWFNGKTTRADSFRASDLGPPGKYKIWCTVTDTYGCESSDTAIIFTNQFLSLNQSDLQMLKVYPNPVSEILTMELGEKGAAVLFSSDGRLLAAYDLMSGNNKINMTSYVGGIYYISITMNGEQRTIKIIKE